jgi:DNA-binding GntR family transcriptional regulator
MHPAVLEAAPGSTLIASAYERLRADILSGHWAPERKLAIDALRARYGTGATPVREALNRLAAEGWVQHLDQRGFSVAPVSDAALRELSNTRIWVESLALTHCIAARGPQWEEGVVIALHRLAKTRRSLSDAHYEENPEWERLHRAFHMALVANCGSRWLTDFCAQLYDQAYRYRQLAVKTAYKRRDELSEHRAIVDALVAGDAPGACAALEAHYRRTTQIVHDAGAGARAP